MSYLLRITLLQDESLHNFRQKQSRFKFISVAKQLEWFLFCSVLFRSCSSQRGNGVKANQVDHAPPHTPQQRGLFFLFHMVSVGAWLCDRTTAAAVSNASPPLPPWGNECSSLRAPRLTTWYCWIYADFLCHRFFKYRVGPNLFWMCCCHMFQNELNNTFSHLKHSNVRRIWFMTLENDCILFLWELYHLPLP